MLEKVATLVNSITFLLLSEFIYRNIVQSVCMWPRLLSFFSLFFLIILLSFLVCHSSRRAGTFWTEIVQLRRQQHLRWWWKSRPFQHHQVNLRLKLQKQLSQYFHHTQTVQVKAMLLWVEYFTYWIISNEQLIQFINVLHRNLKTELLEAKRFI